MIKIILFLLATGSYLGAMQRPAGCSSDFGSGLCLQAVDGDVEFSPVLAQYSGFIDAALRFNQDKSVIDVSPDFSHEAAEIIKNILCIIHDAHVSGSNVRDGLLKFLKRYNPEHLEQIYHIIEYLQIREAQEPVMYALLLHPETPAYFKEEKIGTCVLSEIADRTVLNSVAAQLSLSFGLSLIYKINDSFVYSAVISGDNKHVVAKGFDTVKIYDIKQRKVIGVIEHDGFVNSAVISGNNKYVVTASRDKTVKIYDIKQRKVIGVIEHDGNVYSAVISGNNKYVITASGDKKAKIYDVEQRKVIGVIEHGRIVNSAVISSNNKYVITASDDKRVKIYDIEKGEVIAVIPHVNAVDRSVISADNKYVVTRARNTVKIYDVEKEAVIDEIQDHSRICSAEISGDNKYVVMTSDCGAVKIYDVEKKAVIYEIQDHSLICSAEISGDSKYVVMTSQHNIVEIYDIKQRKVIGEIQHEGTVGWAEISADNKYVVTADHAVRIYDIEKNKIVAVIKYDGTVKRVIISVDSKYVVTVLQNGTIKIIRMSLTNEEISTLNYDQVLFLIWLTEQDKNVVLDKRLHEIYTSLEASIKEYLQGVGYTVTLSLEDVAADA